MPSISIRIQIPEGIHEQARDIAQDDGLTIGHLYQQVICEYIRRLSVAKENTKAARLLEVMMGKVEQAATEEFKDLHPGEKMMRLFLMDGLEAIGKLQPASARGGQNGPRPPIGRGPKATFSDSGGPSSTPTGDNVSHRPARQHTKGRARK